MGFRETSEGWVPWLSLYSVWDVCCLDFSRRLGEVFVGLHGKLGRDQSGTPSSVESDMFRLVNDDWKKVYNFESLSVRPFQSF